MKLEDIFSTLASAVFMQTGRDYQPEWMKHPSVSWEFQRNGANSDEITVHLTWCDTRMEWIGRERFSVTFKRKAWQRASAESLVKMTLIDAAKHCDFNKRKSTEPTTPPE